MDPTAGSLAAAMYNKNGSLRFMPCFVAAWRTYLSIDSGEGNRWIQSISIPIYKLDCEILRWQGKQVLHDVGRFQLTYLPNRAINCLLMPVEFIRFMAIGRLYDCCSLVWEMHIALQDQVFFPHTLFSIFRVQLHVETSFYFEISTLSTPCQTGGP